MADGVAVPPTQRKILVFDRFDGQRPQPRRGRHIIDAQATGRRASVMRSPTMGPPPARYRRELRLGYRCSSSAKGGSTSDNKQEVERTPADQSPPDRSPAERTSTGRTPAARRCGLSAQRGKNGVEILGLDQNFARLGSLARPHDSSRLHQVHQPSGLGESHAQLALQH